MVYFILSFLIGAWVSLVWLLVAIALQVKATKRLRATTTVKRTSLMMVVWFAFAMLLHMAVTRSESFRQGLPGPILKWDIAHNTYSQLALRELHRRLAAGAMDHDQRQVITNSVLNMLESQPVTDDTAVGFDPDDQANAWLGTMVQSTSMSREDLARWMQLAPPPLFAPPQAGNEPGDDDPPAIATLTFGRAWQREHHVPYEIDQVTVVAVRRTGVPCEFELVELEGSDASIGRFAEFVSFAIRVTKTADSGGNDAESDENSSFEVDYVLTIKPGDYAELGPFSWRSE